MDYSLFLLILQPRFIESLDEVVSDHFLSNLLPPLPYGFYLFCLSLFNQ